jgi:RNA-directed DNA polymerase
VLKADIKGFFDEISHDWLMTNVPLPNKLKFLLKSILESGALYLDEFEPTLSGTPQGGVISPLLANFTLDGLEKEIEDSLDGVTESKLKKLTIKRKDGTKTSINLKAVVCRYADDVIIIGRSKNLMEKYIRPALEGFLKVRGLKLSTEKTVLATVKEKELNYLGYTFLYKES